VRCARRKGRGEPEHARPGRLSGQPRRGIGDRGRRNEPKRCAGGYTRLAHGGMCRLSVRGRGFGTLDGAGVIVTRRGGAWRCGDAQGSSARTQSCSRPIGAVRPPDPARQTLKPGSPFRLEGSLAECLPLNGHPPAERKSRFDVCRTYP